VLCGAKADYVDDADRSDAEQRCAGARCVVNDERIAVDTTGGPHTNRSCEQLP